MKRPMPFFAALFAVGLFVTTVQAADWPGFRGPFSSGISPDTELPVKWTSDNFLWKHKLPGLGSASPIVSGDKVIVVSYGGYGSTLTKGNPLGGDKGGKDKGKGGGGEDMKQLKRFVTCVDGKTGKILWEQSVEPKLPEQAWSQMIREHGYASNTPITDGERVYVFFGRTGVLAYDFTGKKLWHTDVGSGTYIYGSAASLAMHKNLVYVNASAESKALIALDKITGKEVWRKNIVQQSGINTPGAWSSPNVVETKEGKFELVLSQPKLVTAYDPETGKELWRCEGLGVPDGGNSYCTPVAKDGIIYLEGGSGPGNHQSAFAVRAGGSGDVTKTHILWKVNKVGGTINSPVIHGEHLYIVENFVTCLRLDNGKQVYRERIGGDAGPYSSPVVAGDKIYQMSRYDGMFVLSIAGGKLKTLAQNAFQGDSSGFTACPAISNGRIYVRSNTYLYCIGNKP